MFRPCRLFDPSLVRMRADVRALLGDDAAYEAAAAEAYPEYNKTHLVSLELPDRSGDIIITTYGEIDRNNYLDPRTAQIATVDHVKQTCTKLRPATDEELPSGYIEEFRNAIDYEVSNYVGEAYPKGVSAVYCTNGKDVEEPGADFGLAVVISAAKRSPRNFCRLKTLDTQSLTSFGITSLSIFHLSRNHT
ncbi:hypothetical protein CFC21_021833 [Triticum aestivum]|uniref:F-actin-capping protein subunit alpha n=3 Tax=Triticum TaxID=4564 RepID=A0A9R1RIA2_TRITD|nr:hypothetical protein CFC21_021833 [Triticum aestivum]VAH42404.1 unnamed protein product [Triticum turgidum subsp. durum]